MGLREVPPSKKGCGLRGKGRTVRLCGICTVRPTLSMSELAANYPLFILSNSHAKKSHLTKGEEFVQ